MFVRISCKKKNRNKFFSGPQTNYYWKKTRQIEERITGCYGYKSMQVEILSTCIFGVTRILKKKKKGTRAKILKSLPVFHYELINAFDNH